MKKIVITTFLILFFIPFCFPKDFKHIVEKSKIVDQPAASQRMTDQLNQAAGMYAKIGKVARIGIYDLAFGASLEEYKKLNSYGVIMIAAQCHDAGELPLKGVYYKSGGKLFSLQLLFSKQVKTLGDAAESMFGANRSHSYYLIPYAFTRTAGQVCVDWGKNRKGFIVAKFPGTLKLDFVSRQEDKFPDKKKSIDADTLGKFLDREFSFSAEEAREAEKNMNTWKLLL
jgi:hypothetical protein